jgi:hypothetical protein
VTLGDWWSRRSGGLSSSVQESFPDKVEECFPGKVEVSLLGSS